jgi:hypothetical protein
MLPLFGKVRAWMMTPDDILRERPGFAPSTSSALMARDLAEEKQIVKNLTRAQLAIAYKWADGVSTPTPAGHWNFIAEGYVRDAQLSEVRAARAFALLNMAMHDAAVGCWDAKYVSFNPRPSQLDPEIRTVVGLPNFPSYTSGHSTFSAAAADVLTYLFPGGASYFDAQKEEAGDFAPLRRDPLPHRHRGGEGSRQADRRLHGAVRHAGLRGRRGADGDCRHHRRRVNSAGRRGRTSLSPLRERAVGRHLVHDLGQQVRELLREFLQ